MAPALTERTSARARARRWPAGGHDESFDVPSAAGAPTRSRSGDHLDSPHHHVPREFCGHQFRRYLAELRDAVIANHGGSHAIGRMLQVYEFIGVRRNLRRGKFANRGRCKGVVKHGSSELAQIHLEKITGMDRPETTRRVATLTELGPCLYRDPHPS